MVRCMEYINDELAGIGFTTIKGNRYFYDDNTGLIFYCPDIMYEILKQYKTKDSEQIYIDFDGSHSKDEILRYYSFIDKWIKKHNSFFFKENNTKFSDFTEKEIRDFVFTHGFHQLVLNVTEGCNLKCKYCVYFSEAYLHYQRQYQDKMDFSIAKKAIDYYIEGYKKVKKGSPYKRGAITFYGGEPLLNFKLIKEIINYLKSIGEDNSFIYSITTNGTLLTNEIIDFLVTNDFVISVSLDGPEEIHDNNRKYIDGRGSFSTVIKNILQLRERYPNYNNLVFLNCYDFNSNLVMVNQFFSEIEKITKPALIRASMVSPYFTSYYDQFKNNDNRKFKEHIIAMRINFFDKIIKSESSSKYLEALIGTECRAPLLRSIIDEPHSNILPYTGACVPGVKIFVSCRGTFHICEKMNENFSIGDVNNGLDFMKIRDIILNYRRQVLTDCGKCPITRLCSVCYVPFAAEGKFEKSPEFCKKLIEITAGRLRNTYSILEEKPDAFKNLVEDYYDKSRETVIRQDF